MLTRDSYVAEGLDASKIHVIPLGAPPVSTAPRQLRSDNTLRIIWAGTFSLRKGAHHLLAAWQQVALDRCNVVLDVFGTPTLPAKLLSNLPANIRFHGPVPQQDLYAHFLQADLLVLPTLCDGFGMVITEAMAHGLPVLTTPNAGAAQFIKHGVNGILVQVGNTEALSTALCGLLNARESLHDMGIAAQQTAAAWQWSDFRVAHRRVIDDFLSSRPA
jgi:glycosyltransferase involved in cell wall biosynthesis